MSLFEDFVGLELPRRSALLTKTITGHDASPNVAPPAIIALAPLGTWFREETSGKWWRKTETVWEEQGTGGGGGASSYERHASFGVDVGASVQEATIGRITFDGSLIGISVHAEDATTAGTLTVNAKINGVTKLTAILSAGNPESNFATASIDTHLLVQGDEVSIEVVGDASYDNASLDITGLVVNVTMADGSAAVVPNFALLDVPQTFSAGQAIAQVTLADGVGIAVDADLGNNFDLELTQNSDLANPTNVVAGMVLNFAVRQDGVGGFTLGYGSAFLFPGGAPTVTATALAEDMISCYVRAESAGVATVMLCSIAQGHV